MIKPPANDKNYLYKEIMSNLKSKIQCGEYKKKDQLPTIQGLAQIYNVSDITIRRCLKEMIKEGYLFSRPGMGTYVLDINGNSSAPLPQIKKIGIISKNVSKKKLGSSSYEVMLYGINSSAKKLNIESMTFTTKDVKRFGGIDSFCESNGLQGLILHGIKDEDYIQQIASSTPVVVLDYWFEDPSLDYIVVDNIPAAITLTNKLIELGHNRIAFLGAYERDIVNDTKIIDPDAHLRIAGYRMALEKAGLKEMDQTIFLSEKEEEKEIKELLASKSRPSALFCFGRSQAIRIKSILESFGVNVPNEMSIVTFSGDPQALKSTYELSCMYADCQLMGQMALEQLTKQIKNENSEAIKIAIPCTFVKGKTIAKPNK